MNKKFPQDLEFELILSKELARQVNEVSLIASENYVSDAVLAAAGSIFTNKYAEGYPGKRYYGGCQYMDEIENLAIKRVKELFGAEHVNVQPHSGSQANMAVFMSILKPGDTILGMNLAEGGHLTHGHPVNFSGSIYNAIAYGVDENGLIDYDKVEELALEHKPKIIIAGASAYSRVIDFERFQKIADKSGAYFMADMAHIAGLVATGLHPNPVPYADFVTSTTHKTLRGPRGGIIMCKQKYADKIDKSVMPGIQGGPLMHIISAKAVAFKEALKPEFKTYQEQVVKNSKLMANTFKENGFKIISQTTDNHMFLVDLSNKDLNGKECEKLLEKAGVYVNRNTIPNDQQKPWIGSGIRVGTPAITTKGFKENEVRELTQIMVEIIETKEVKQDHIDRVKTLNSFCLDALVGKFNHLSV
jgi:glycine hydroxymethyltransferase